MTFTDHCMQVLGTASLAVFAFAGGFAIMTLIDDLIPNIERITAALFPVSNAAGSMLRPDEAEAKLTAEVR